MALFGNVSLVFQGPVLGTADAPAEKQLTRKCLEHTRAALPGAELILSTWKGTDTTGLTFDRVVYSDDPGNWTRDDGVPCNVNRQIVSTYQGLLAATRPYAAKIRTDTALTGPGFIGLQAAAHPRNPAAGVFEQRILILEKYTRHPGRLPLLHHPSDIFQFGLATDLRRLWGVPLSDPKDMVGWSAKKNRPWLRPFANAHVFCRYADEQYVWVALLRSLGRVRPLDYLWQCRLADFGASESLLVNNFLVVSERAADVQLAAKFATHAWPESCYSASEWAALMPGYASASAVHRWRRSLSLYASSRAVLWSTSKKALFRKLTKAPA